MTIEYYYIKQGVKQSGKFRAKIQFSAEWGKIWQQLWKVDIQGIQYNTVKSTNYMQPDHEGELKSKTQNGKGESQEVLLSGKLKCDWCKKCFLELLKQKWSAKLNIS